MTQHILPFYAKASEDKPNPDLAPTQASLYTLLAPFTGNAYRFLLACLKDSQRSHADICREIGVAPERPSIWRWGIKGFRQAEEAIAASRADLRTEYAKLAFLEATPRIADSMVTRAQGQGVAAQRAGERILETVGVLKQGGMDTQVPVQVVTHTYVLVQREPSALGVTVGVVEGEAKALPPATPS